MPVFPQLTEDNDWVLGAVVTGNDAILLDVKTACQEWLRDCWFNQNAGIDWKVVLGGGDTTQFLLQQLQTVISGRKGVASITKLKSKKKDVVIYVDVSFITIYGVELNFVIENV